jgi:hypothetical protein
MLTKSILKTLCSGLSLTFTWMRNWWKDCRRIGRKAVVSFEIDCVLVALKTSVSKI